MSVLYCFPDIPTAVESSGSSGMAVIRRVRVQPDAGKVRIGRPPDSAISATACRRCRASSSRAAVASVTSVRSRKMSKATRKPTAFRLAPARRKGGTLP